MHTTPDGTPPPYQLRISARARRVRLEISPGKGLVLVIPERFPLGRVPDILERHRAWIEAAFARQSRRPPPPPTPSWQLPSAIELPALGSSWRVAAHATAAPWVTVHASQEQRLTLAGRTTEERACRAALGRWLVRQAQAHLPPRLEALSRQTGLRYAQVTIRRQQTRWGSCARGSRIALNARLLFLPPELVEYVCLHELCHTVHLNHSPKFWGLVHAYCPETPLRRAALRAAGPLVPPWA